MARPRCILPGFLAFLVLATVAAGPAALAASNPVAPTPPAPTPTACAADAWVDVRCYGAAGNGVSDDTAAVNRALRAALATGEPLFFPHGTFKLTRTLVIDYAAWADSGFRVISMGAVLDGRTISSAPVLEILCSGGTASSSKGCFYFNEQGTLFVNANTDGYAVEIGQRDFSDAQNSIKIDHLVVNNANAGKRAGGLQLNYVLNSQIFAVADSAGGAAGIALEQTQISHIGGAGSASAKGGAGLLIENGYSFANTIDAMDLEVAPTCLVIASRNATRLVNPLFGGNVKTQFAAAIGVDAAP